ncbi:MAG: hypothetical protein M1834_002607 [Cirrosporium novae-zelandiae]|nr:MAG: hypothetical protein M1834_002607 [Cirrosporium novae-zelandiae]
MAASNSNRISSTIVSYSSLPSDNGAAEDNELQDLEPSISQNNTEDTYPPTAQSYSSSRLNLTANNHDGESSNLDMEQDYFLELDGFIVWYQTPQIDLEQLDDRNETANQSLDSGRTYTLLDLEPSQSSTRGSVEQPRFFKSDWLIPWVPQLDPNSPEANKMRSWTSKRSNVLIGMALLSTTVLVVNLVATIMFKKTGDPANDLGMLYRGDCITVRRLSIGIHAAINVLSTLLLSSSNFCMQLLSAPTRAEIDESHRKHQPLDIGVPSIRNLAAISWKQKAVWAILVLSSLPLHFLFNSAIIPTLAINSYVYIAVSPEFLDEGSWNTSATASTLLSLPSPLNNTAGMLQSWDDAPLDLQMTIHEMQVGFSNDGGFVHLDKLTCLLEYTNLFGNRSDVVMVSNTAPPDNNSLLTYGLARDATWDEGLTLCWDSNSFDCLKLDLSNFPSGEAGREKATANWNMAGYKIDHCLSAQRSTDGLCSVEYSFSIMLGDAVASFLSHPDATTQNMSAIGKYTPSRDPDSWRDIQPTRWEQRRSFWKSAAGGRRWSICLISCGLMFIAAFTVLVCGIRSLRGTGIYPSLKSILDMGFGAVNSRSFANNIGPKSMASTVRRLYTSVLFVNSWQLFVSIIYVSCNTVLTCMLVAAEWDTFAEKWKTLRVSEPTGLRRSSYFLSMPLKFGLPFMTSMSLIHWSISQSVFIVSLNRFFSNGVEDMENRTITIGYSVYAIIVC